MVVLDPRGLLDDARRWRRRSLSVKKRSHSASLKVIALSVSSWARRLATSVGLGRDREPLVGLRLELRDERALEVGLGLVGRRSLLAGDELRDDGTLGADRDRLVARAHAGLLSRRHGVPSRAAVKAPLLLRRPSSHQWR